VRVLPNSQSVFTNVFDKLMMHAFIAARADRKVNTLRLEFFRCTLRQLFASF
jgi:hypothetical protein